MNFTEKKFQVFNEADQIKIFNKYAIEFLNDWLKIDRSPGTGFKSLSAVAEFSQKKYKLEKGEIILRPFYFYLFGGDCDDQYIFFISYCIFKGFPVENLYTVLQSWDDGETWRHIYPAVRFGETLLQYNMLPEKDLIKSSENPSILRILNFKDFI